ncbi:spore coat protein [Clostridium carnis]
MVYIKDNGLYLYFKERDIVISNKKNDIEKVKSNKDILNQVENIAIFHEYIDGYKENLIPRIGASIGKDIEGFKGQVLKLKKDLNRIKKKGSSNFLESILEKQGKVLLDAAEESIFNTLSNNYEELIKRSMRSYEVCLIKVDEGNLRKREDGKLEIGTIKYLTYNLKEHDLYCYVRRLKRKDINLDIDNYIEEYIERTSLKRDSIEYLKGVCSYPLESLKIWEKYIDGKITMDEEEFVIEFKNAINIDKKYMIYKGGVMSE